VAIARGQLDAVHRYAAAVQRQRDPPGPDAEFQCRAAAGHLGEQIDCRVDHCRVEQLGPQPLVLLGDPLIEPYVRHPPTVGQQHGGRR
jgi:hypothetical protein